MPELKRTLGLIECTLMGVGVMLGAGIYALVGQASLFAGNMVWASFLLASFVAGCTGLSYAELSSFIPKAGGEYYYTRRGLGNLAAFLVSAVTAMLAIRLFLRLTGYPQLGGGPLHIAHMLWGGLLMLTAIVIMLSYLGEAAGRRHVSRGGPTAPALGRYRVGASA